MATSKTARRSTPSSSSKQQFRREGKPHWVTPMAKGTYARVMDPASSRMLHLRTDSDEFVTAVQALIDFGVGAEVRELLEGYGWDSQIAFLDAAGAFTPAEDEAAA